MRKRSSERGEAVTSGPRPLTWNLGKLSPEKGGVTHLAPKSWGGWSGTGSEWKNMATSGVRIKCCLICRYCSVSVTQFIRHRGRSTRALSLHENDLQEMFEMSIVKTFTRWCWLLIDNTGKNLLDQSAAMSQMSKTFPLWELDSKRCMK